MPKITKEKWEGQIFGDLTIIEYLGRDHNGSYKIIAKCKCGKVKEYYLANLIKKGHTTSCGCAKLIKISNANKTHGISIRHPLYLIWRGIKSRCNNPNDQSYRDYGANGVKMCDLWADDFKSFYDWCLSNGWRKGLNVDKDKIPKELGVPAVLYSPEMCSIVTSQENQNNRRDNIIVEYKGESCTLSEIARKYGIRYRLLWERCIKRGWDLGKAIDTPLKIKQNA